MLTPAVVSRAQISVLFHCELMSFLRVMMTTRKDKLDDGDMMVRVVAGSAFFSVRPHTTG